MLAVRTMKRKRPTCVKQATEANISLLLLLEDHSTFKKKTGASIILLLLVAWSFCTSAEKLLF